MIGLDNRFIDSILQDKGNKNFKCHENKDLITQWSYSTTNYFNYFMGKCSLYEVALAIRSNQYYLQNKQNSINKVSYSPRQLLMVELGTNCNNFSYKHPCIVMYDVFDKIFVIPCTSGYAPKDRNGDIHKGYLEGDTPDGFDHTSTIMLKEGRFIDKTQIIYAIKDIRGKFKKVSKPFYEKLYDEMFKLLFNGKNYKITKLEETITDITSQNSKLENKNTNLESINSKIEKELLELKHKNTQLEKELEIAKMVAFSNEKNIG